MQRSFAIKQRQASSSQRCSTKYYHHRKLLLSNSTKATLENTSAKNTACSSIQNPITFLFSTADPRKRKHANVLLVPLIILLYYLSFFSPLSAETIPSALLTSLVLCLLTNHRLSAISSLLAFRETKEFKDVSKSSDRLIDFLAGQHVLSFILELVLCYDYWFPSLCQRHGLEIVVYATIGLIFTVLVSTIRLLTMSNNYFIIDHKRPLLSFFTLHKLFYIPLVWLVVLTYGQLEISLTECHHGPAAAHFYILVTIIWFPASNTLYPLRVY